MKRKKFAKIGEHLYKTKKYLFKQKQKTLPEFTNSCVVSPVSVYCVLYTVYCILYTENCTVYTAHCIVYTVQCPLYVHCTCLQSWATVQKCTLLLLATFCLKNSVLYICRYIY